uniref:Uncharacterized protein n=1 Tax=Arundo donax TaxID=35708 RepID=A0A0A9CCE9_ARUDO
MQTGAERARQGRNRSQSRRKQKGGLFGPRTNLAGIFTFPGFLFPFPFPPLLRLVGGDGK